MLVYLWSEHVFFNISIVQDNGKTLLPFVHTIVFVASSHLLVLFIFVQAQRSFKRSSKCLSEGLLFRLSFSVLSFSSISHSSMPHMFWRSIHTLVRFKSSNRRECVSIAQSKNSRSEKKANGLSDWEKNETERNGERKRRRSRYWLYMRGIQEPMEALDKRKEGDGGNDQYTYGAETSLQVFTLHTWWWTDEWQTIPMSSIQIHRKFFQPEM